MAGRSLQPCTWSTEKARSAYTLTCNPSQPKPRCAAVIPNMNQPSNNQHTCTCSTVPAKGVWCNMPSYTYTTISSAPPGTPPPQKKQSPMATVMNAQGRSVQTQPTTTCVGVRFTVAAVLQLNQTTKQLQQRASLSGDYQKTPVPQQQHTQHTVGLSRPLHKLNMRGSGHSRRWHILCHLSLG